MTEVEILDGLIDREAGYVNHPADKGGPTKFGITAETLGNYLGLGRAATVKEMKAMPRETADAIYRVRYIALPGFTPENVPFEPLRVQLIDFGVNSGPERALRWLQRVIVVKVTGKMDDDTKGILKVLSRADYFALRLVNDALVAARLYMVDSWTDADTTQKVFEEGVESRALSFLLAKPSK